ncbi:MAG: hypothetical protein EOM58_03355 [Clostridia bacterium]|nr:hypothetical protein [Clostridia bacterium]
MMDTLENARDMMRQGALRHREPPWRFRIWKVTAHERKSDLDVISQPVSPDTPQGAAVPFRPRFAGAVPHAQKTATALFGIRCSLLWNRWSGAGRVAISRHGA